MTKPVFKAVHTGRIQQRGITLIVGMIMLVLITLVVTATYSLSTTNSKAVSNMQFRDEAIAAANKGLEQTMSTVFTTGFTTLPTAVTSYTLDINNDGATDYTITIDIPVCVQSTTEASSGSAGLSSAAVSLTGASTYYNTVWDLTAKVTDPVSGTSIEIHQGIRVPLSETQKPLVCP